MKKRIGLLCVLAVAFLPVAELRAEVQQQSQVIYEVNWQVYSSGGRSANATYRVQQAIGQTAAGWTYPVGIRLNSGFEQAFLLSGCCNGIAGNVDCDLAEGVDISDLSTLIDYLYISFTPLCCPGEANVDGDLAGGIDISDLSGLIDYLYISFTPPAACQ